VSPRRKRFGAETSSPSIHGHPNLSLCHKATILDEYNSRYTNDAKVKRWHLAKQFSPNGKRLMKHSPATRNTGLPLIMR